MSFAKTANFDGSPFWQRLYQMPKPIGFHSDAAGIVGLMRLNAAPAGVTSRIANSVAIWDEFKLRDGNYILAGFASRGRQSHPRTNVASPRIFSAP